MAKFDSRQRRRGIAHLGDELVHDGRPEIATAQEDGRERDAGAEVQERDAADAQRIDAHHDQLEEHAAGEWHGGGERPEAAQNGHQVLVQLRMRCWQAVRRASGSLLPGALPFACRAPLRCSEHVPFVQGSSRPAESRDDTCLHSERSTGLLPCPVIPCTRCCFANAAVRQHTVKELQRSRGVGINDAGEATYLVFVAAV